MSVGLKNLSELRNKSKEISSILLASIILAGLLYIGNTTEVVDNIRSTNPAYYVSALLVFSLTYLPAELRWKFLCVKIDVKISHIQSFKIFSISTALNKILPFNSGDLLRSRIMQEHTDIPSHTNILGLVIIERLLDLAGLITITAISIALIGTTSNSILLGLFFFVCIILIFLIPFVLGESETEHISDTLPAKLDGYFSNIMDSYQRVELGTMVEGYFLTLIRWGLDVLVFYLLAASIGLDLSYAVSSLTTSSISLANALPLTPGGVGTAEAVGSGVLKLVGVNYNNALSLVILQRSLGYLGSLTLGLLSAIPDGLRLNRYLR